MQRHNLCSLRKLLMRRATLRAFPDDNEEFSNPKDLIPVAKCFPVLNLLFQISVREGWLKIIDRSRMQKTFTLTPPDLTHGSTNILKIGYAPRVSEILGYLFVK